MKKLLFVIFVIGLIGCTNPINKSIFDPLNIKELSKALEKDTLFENVYRDIRFIVDTVIKSDIDKAKWMKLSYSRYLKYDKFERDTSYFGPIERKSEAEWQRKYGKYIVKADSIINWWENYRNSLGEYVMIELVELYKKKYEYLDYIEKIYLGFRLTPLKGPIERLVFGYKINKKSSSCSLDEMIGSNSDFTNCTFYPSLAKPTIERFEVGVLVKRDLEYENITSLLKNFTVEIEVKSVRVNDQDISLEDIRVPESVKKYVRYHDMEYMEEYYKADIIKELLNKDFLRQHEYESIEYNKILKAKDPLSFEFSKFVVDSRIKQWDARIKQ